MRRVIRDKGYIYVLIAVLCLSIFFVGFEFIRISYVEDMDVINKYEEGMEKIDLEDDDNELDNNINMENISDDGEEAVTAFINIDDGTGSTKSMSYNSVSENFSNDDFFLKLLTSSNAFMEVAIERSIGTDEYVNIGGAILNKILKSISPMDYFKSQLPAILSLVDSVEVNSSELEILNKDEEEVPIVGDIIFVEDPVEAEEGEAVPDIAENEEGESIQVVEIPKAIKLDDENPSILIYHTHGTESYLPMKENRFHTTNRQYNVVTIGETIGMVLSENGHKIKHVDIYHDTPSYSQSYEKSLATVTTTKEEEKSIKVIFDIHRDGIEGEAAVIEKAKKQSKVTINGKDVATFSLVIGPQNPNKQELLKFAQYIKSVSDELYPGLCTKIIIKPYGKFNQYVSDYYALIEVGSNLNTIDEANESAKLIGEVLHKAIEGISQSPTE